MSLTVLLMAPLVAAVFYLVVFFCFYASSWTFLIASLLLCNADSTSDHTGVVVFTVRYRMSTFYDRVSLASWSWLDGIAPPY